jgi:predicted TPR repeat methyltransferase
MTVSERENAPDLHDAYALRTPDDSRRLYGEWAEDYDSDFAARRGYRLAREVAEAFVAAGGTGPALDAGCGTGLVADALPEGIVADGMDISPEMLAQAREKARYRDLFEADMTRGLPMDEGAYAGLTCAGTFTHGHVGPEALDTLVRALRPGGVGAVSVRRALWADGGFREAFAALAARDAISPVRTVERRIYAEDGENADGHGDDMAVIATFRRL